MDILKFMLLYKRDITLLAIGVSVLTLKLDLQTHHYSNKISSTKGKWAVFKSGPIRANN